MLPVIDVFAGPGGLGEGFSKAGFDVMLSCEVDPIACKTLKLRHFFHQFTDGKVPKEYYEFITGNIELSKLSELYPHEWQEAENKVYEVELGNQQSKEKVHKKLTETLKNYRNFILIGGPPCQAYSLAGRSRRLGLGKNGTDKKLSAQKRKNLKASLEKDFYNDERHNLYLAYLEILAIHKPVAFVMENVKGLGSAKVDASDNAGSVFNKITSGLKNPCETLSEFSNNLKKTSNVRYKLVTIANYSDEKPLKNFDKEPVNGKDFLVKAEEHGIPQARHRIIIIGIRDDIIGQPDKLKTQKNKATVRDAIFQMIKLRSGLSKIEDNNKSWREKLHDLGSQVLSTSTDENLMISKLLQKILNSNQNLTRGGKAIIYSNKHSRNNILEFVIDPKLKFLIQNETRSHQEMDLIRYLFCAAFANKHNRSPKLSEWQGDINKLRPQHQNISVSNGKLMSVNHPDRFKVQVWNKPSSTIVSHIAKDGHYYIHPDPLQCRSLTVREAARLQTFPDNYHFAGNRTEQFHQVGNAVPVLLTYQIATAIFEWLFSFRNQFEENIEPRQKNTVSS